MYCKEHGYSHRSRRRGLKYRIVKDNPTSFKVGQKPWNTGFSTPYLDKSTGYMKIKIDGKDMKYHRYVMEQEIGRKLLTEELVHHIDHDKLNNAIENLEIMSVSVHMKYHWADRRQKQYA